MQRKTRNAASMDTSPPNVRSMTSTRNLLARSAAQGSHAGGSHATQAKDPGRQSGVRSPQRDRGTGVRPDQAGARIPAVSVAWYRQSAGGVVTRVPHAQHFEDLPALL